MELLFTKRDNYPEEGEGKNLIVLEKNQAAISRILLLRCTRSFTNAKFIYDLDPGQISLSSALTLLSALGSTEPSLFETRRMNVLVSVNAPSGTFDCSSSRPSFFFRDFPLDHDPPSYSRPAIVYRCSRRILAVEEKRNRARRRIENVISVVSMNYHLVHRS